MQHPTGSCRSGWLRTALASGNCADGYIKIRHGVLLVSRPTLLLGSACPHGLVSVFRSVDHSITPLDVGQRGHLLLNEQDDVHSVFQLSFLEHLHKAFVCLSAHLVDIGAHAPVHPFRFSQLVDTVDALEAVQVLPISRGYSGGKGVGCHFPSLSGSASPRLQAG